MKRCLGILLALILLCGQVSAPALAEQDTVAPIAVDNAQLAEPDGTAESLDGGDIAADVDPSAPELIDGEQICSTPLQGPSAGSRYTSFSSSYSLTFTPGSGYPMESSSLSGVDSMTAAPASELP